MDAAVDTVKSFEETEETENGRNIEKRNTEKKKRSRTVAGILALLLGTVGAHKFYQGKYVQGILFLLFFWTFIPGVLAMIEGAHLLGSDDDFEDDEDLDDFEEHDEVWEQDVQMEANVDKEADTDREADVDKEADTDREADVDKDLDSVKKIDS